MPKWEYLTRSVETGMSPEKADGVLANLGADGWELVAVVLHFNLHVCYFKRLVAEAV